jgi:hypothetical protein
MHTIFIHYNILENAFFLLHVLTVHMVYDVLKVILVKITQLSTRIVLRLAYGVVGAHVNLSV